jgi:hypothetical protein
MDNVELFGNAEDNSIANDQNADPNQGDGGGSADENLDLLTPEIDVEVPGADDTQEAAAGEKDKSPKEEKPAKDDPSRFQYWQSQADQYKRQLELERQQYQAAAAYAPIAKYLQENPQLLDVLERELQGGHPAQGAPVQRQQAEQRTSLERPEKPLKPRNYDPNETDPESDSYKYRQAMAEYQENLMEYMVSRDEYREQQARERERLEQEQRRQQEQMSQTANMLKVEYGMNDFEAQDFLRTMMDPQSVTIENLIALYRMRHNGGNKQGAEAKRKAQEILERSGKKVPLPAGVGGVNAPQVSDEDIFNASLSFYGNR